jgi:uncharacterized protein (TIGR02266 family)
MAEGAVIGSRASLHNRVHPRVEFQVEVTLESDHNFYTGLTSNVSEGGLFVASESLPPIGTRLVIRFALGDSPEHIDAVGEVRWLRDVRSSDFPRGFGLRFLEISAAALDRVVAFVAGRESIFFEE